MSMQEYTFFDIAVILTEKQIIALGREYAKKNGEEKGLPETFGECAGYAQEIPGICYDTDTIVQKYPFDTESGKINYSEQEREEYEEFYYYSLQKTPSLFSPTYSNIEEIKEEMKNIMGEYFDVLNVDLSKQLFLIAVSSFG